MRTSSQFLHTRHIAVRPRRRPTRTRERGTSAAAVEGHRHCATHFLVPGSCLIQMHVIGSFGWGKQTLTHGLAYDCHNLDWSSLRCVQTVSAALICQT